MTGPSANTDESTVLVTGASGFIGSALVRYLVRNGRNVVATASSSRHRSRLEECAERVTWVEADLLDPGQRSALLAQHPTDVVCHLAWHVDPRTYLESPLNLSHLTASIDFVREILQRGTKRLLITGTCYEYDVSRGYLAEDAPTRPAHLYSACKLALLRVSEQLARQSQATLVWARLFWQYGPHEDERRLVPHVLSTLRRGDDVVLRTHGRQVRDFLHVYDVAAALALAAFEAPSGVINIGSGEPTTVRDLTTRIAEMLGLGKVDYADDDTPLTEPAFVCADNSKLKQLGWQARKGIVDLLSYNP